MANAATSPTQFSASISRIAREAGIGLVLGSLVVGVIAVTDCLVPDLLFHPQLILVSLVGLFFGVVPTLVVMVCTAAFTLFQDDIAVSVGVVAILLSGVFGLSWRMVRKPDLKAITWRELLVFGATVQLLMIGLLLVMSAESPGDLLAAGAMPVLGIFTMATAFLGKLLATFFQYRANTERLELILQGANDGWWDWDLVRNVLTYSPRWWQMLGLEPDALPADADLWRNLMHPDDLERANQKFAATLADGDDQYEVEFRLRHSEGHYISVISRGHVQRNSSGKPVRVSGTNVDITPMRLALEEANAAKFWLESAGRIGRIGYWELSFETQSVVWSEITCEIHEVPHGFTSSLTEALSYLPGEYHSAITTDLENLRLHGQSFTGEYQIITSSGRRVWVQSRGEPIADDASRITGARGVFQDIDAQKRAAEALAASNRNYREIFDATADAIFIHDEANGRIIDVNDAMLRMYGFPDKASALACKLDELSLGEAPYSPEDERRHIKAALEQGPQVFEWHTRRADRSTFWVEVSLRRSEIGGQGCLLACCRDITQRKELEARVREAEKMESLGRLAGGIAHDFNNMLGVIIGQTDLAEVLLGNGQCSRENLAEIRSAALRSAALVRQLLTFARKQEITPTVIDLNHSVDNALSLLRRLIGEHIALEWQPGPALWPIKIDPAQIDQILTNLAVNARDAMQDNGAITVRTFNESADTVDRVVIQFSDTGSGMDPEILKHVFEPFFTTKDVGKGTGLGLATVYGIVEQNNGTIEVESRPGHGTTFRIQFPRAVEAVQPAGEDASPPTSLPRGTESILLVEDEPGILHIATMVLRFNGYTVFPMSNPQSALDFITEDDRPIHLVISDVIMPEINGRALREKILATLPGIKFLFISGYSGDVLGDIDLNDPSIAFLSKPFSAEALANEVRKCLDVQKSPWLLSNACKVS